MTTTQAAITSRMKKAFAAIVYMSDTELDKLELYLTQHMRKDPVAGAIRQSASRSCDVLATAVKVASILHPSSNIHENGDALLARLATGTSAEMAYLAVLVGTKLTRGDYSLLMRDGLTGIDILDQASDDQILGCVGGDSLKLLEIRGAIDVARENNLADGIDIKPYESAKA